MPDERPPALEGEIAHVARRRRASEDAAFHAGMEERLRGLEGQLSEVKSRLNGLLFFIVSTVVAQVLLRLFE